MAIKKDTLDQLLDGRDPKEVFNKDGLFDELKKALAERVLNAELDDHLESEAPAGRRNHRNGHSKKTVLTETAKLDIRIPREQLRLDGGDLPQAAFHSRRCSCTFCRDILERTAISIESGLLAGELLPARDNHVGVFGIQLHPVANALVQLRGR
jgi:hypothetical protein